MRSALLSDRICTSSGRKRASPATLLNLIVYRRVRNLTGRFVLWDGYGTLDSDRSCPVTVTVYLLQFLLDESSRRHVVHSECCPLNHRGRLIPSECQDYASLKVIIPSMSKPFLNPSMAIWRKRSRFEVGGASCASGPVPPGSAQDDVGSYSGIRTPEACMCGRHLLPLSA
jgi:hypothetical protein